MSQHNMLSYEETYKGFKWEYPGEYNFARDVIDKWAEDASKLAIFWVDDNGNECVAH